MINRKRNALIKIRVTATEKARFDAEYAKSGLSSRADFIAALMRDKPVVVVNDLMPVLAELRRQGNNLNQIAHKLNAEGDINSATMTMLIERWMQTFDTLMHTALEVRKNAGL